MNIPSSFRAVRVVAGATILLALASAACGSAQAEDGYVSVTPGATLMTFPEHRFFGEFLGSSGHRIGDLDVDPSDEGIYGFSIDGRIGFFLPEPLFGSGRSGIEARIRGQFAETDSSAIFNDTPSTRYGWVLLNNANGFGTPAGGTLSTRIDREFDYWTADLLAQQEVAISESGMMKLFIGPSFRYLHENTQADGSLSSGAQVTLTEQLSTTYLGASAGAEGELQFDELTSIQLGVLASLYSASSTYDGLQTGSSTGASGISASLKDEETAVGVDIRAEIKRKLSPTIALSLVLGGHYLSYAPQMAYGGARIVSDPARPLHMEGAALLSGDIGLKLTAEF